MGVDPEELAEAEVARLRELHAAGALDDEELRAGIAEARMAAGLPAAAGRRDGGAEVVAGRRVSRLPIILAFVAVDVVIVVAVLVVLLAD